MSNKLTPAELAGLDFLIAARRENAAFTATLLTAVTRATPTVVRVTRVTVQTATMVTDLIGGARAEDISYFKSSAVTGDQALNELIELRRQATE